MRQGAVDWIRGVAAGAVYDLGRELSPETPHHPNHAPLLHRLAKAHGDVVDDCGMSASNDVFTMGTHVGTHIDGLAHVSVDGRLAGGVEASEVQDRLTGFDPEYGIGAVPPIVLPGIVIDVPRLLGTEALSLDHEVTTEEVQDCLERQETSIPEGGAFLVRTGWGTKWPDADPRLHESPGPGESAVRWAWDQGARLFASDTLVFEHVPSGNGLPVHRLLLAGRGAHIIEAMDLEELCAEEAWDFVLIVAPLKLRGATGSPIRPVALVPPPG